MQTQNSASQANIVSFFERIIVPSIGAREVPFIYHTPRFSRYSPSTQLTNTVVLSITPTPSFYAAAKGSNSPVGFLHRPWGLSRKRLGRDALVVANHASFDEHLTVGWNVELAWRLGLDLNDAVCIQGYKENTDRKIGLVARFSEPVELEILQARLKAEYAGAGALHQPGDNDAAVRIVSKIQCLAIMNAFRLEEIERVLAAARSRDWIGPEDDGRSILYLTGAARDYGLEAAKQFNMPAYCVGHRECEEWGIRYLAEVLRMQWPLLNVVEVLEDEESTQKPTNATKSPPASVTQDTSEE